MKSKSVTPNGIELTVEVKLNECSTKVCNILAEADGVTRCALVSYNGEYMA